MKFTKSTEKKSNDQVTRGTQSTVTKSSDPVTRAIIRSLASILIALSGLMLFTDKVFDIPLDNTYGFKSAKTFIWVFMQTLSPLVLILGATFRAYRISYTIPTYIYTVQLVWVFRPDIKFDDALLQVYALGATLGFVAMAACIDYFIRRAHEERASKISLLEKLLDLSFKVGRKNGKEV